MYYICANFNEMPMFLSNLNFINFKMQWHRNPSEAIVFETVGECYQIIGRHAVKVNKGFDFFLATKKDGILYKLEDSLLTNEIIIPKTTSWRSHTFLQATIKQINK